MSTLLKSLLATFNKSKQAKPAAPKPPKVAQAKKKPPNPPKTLKSRKPRPKKSWLLPVSKPTKLEKQPE